jgi:thioredoxin 1
LADREFPQFDESSFEEQVVRRPGLTVVDFWAEWCVPCRTLLPSVEAVAERFKDVLRVGKLNVEENPDVPTRYNVITLPTLLLLKGGQVVEQRVGLISKDKLIQLLQPHLS